MTRLARLAAATFVAATTAAASAHQRGSSSPLPPQPSSIDQPAAPAATPLSPEEEKRFAAGRGIYGTLCQVCHQEDGEGAGVAANLVESPIVIGRPDVALRVLLNGKEGEFGLMPPLGIGLDDGQIAAVLTYLRREWGHEASAVTPDEVKAIRVLTADRTAPWTDDELKTLLVNGRPAQ